MFRPGSGIAAGILIALGHGARAPRRMGRHGRKHGGKFLLGQERLELTRFCPVRHCAGFIGGLAYRAPVRVRLQHR